MSLQPVRFGQFELFPATGELRRDGIPVKLQAQPAKVLCALVDRPGEIVTREKLKAEVWDRDTHVDFERGLNFCVAQIRSALGDSADAPRYVETVPKQGYRFIAPVQTATHRPVAGEADPAAAAPMRRSWIRGGLALAAVFAIAMAVIAGWTRASAEPPTIIVVPFYNETGRPELDPVARGISDETVARLAAPERLQRLSVIGNAASLKNPFAREDVQRIAASLDASWVLIGQLKADGRQLRVIAHLIRAADMKHLWAQAFDDEGFALEGQSRVAEAIAASVTSSLTSAAK